MEPARPKPDVVAIIRAAADRHCISRRVALAFAWVESRHDPSAEGDLLWHERQGGELYRRNVLESSRLHDNPYRLQPELWHSYGLFALLACWHVHGREHPRLLLDPEINAERGCAQIARHLVRTQGDPLTARFAFIGAGYSGQLIPYARRVVVRRNLQEAMSRFAQET